MAYIPYRKLAKRKQREQDARKRETWGQIKPVTRKIESSKTYNRKKTRRWDADGGFSLPGLFNAPEPNFQRMFWVDGRRVY